MAEIRFSLAVNYDLNAIDDYSIDRFGEAVATEYLRSFDEAWALLADHPFAGRTEPDLGKDIRCLTHRQHRIFYRVEGGAAERVLIVRILHHAMDAQAGIGKTK